MHAFFREQDVPELRKKLPAKLCRIFPNFRFQNIRQPCRYRCEIGKSPMGETGLCLLDNAVILITTSSTVFPLLAWQRSSYGF